MPKDWIVYDPEISNTWKSQIESIQEIQNLGFLKRVFRTLNTGSMRGVVLMWVRMTLGIGILTLPFYIKTYGANLGLIILILSALINYYTYVYIFEASYYTGK